MATVQSIETNRFFVRGNSHDVASKLASLVTCTEPGGTGTGIAKQLDLAIFRHDDWAKLGLNPLDISEAYTVNRLHMDQFTSELAMLLLGQQSGIMAVVFEYRNRPGVSEVRPSCKDGPINPNYLSKVDLELLTE